MKLTKHTHACVELEADGVKIIIDPGEFERKAEKLATGANAVLFTHEHMDHIDLKAILSALEKNSDLRVYAPFSMLDKIGSHGGRVIAVKPGDTFMVGSIPIQVFGGTHAPIHESIPTIDNVAYFINNDVYDPGDSFDIPDADVKTLLLPTSGPWMKIGEAADFVLAVRPSRSVPIHDGMNSDAGNSFAAMQLGQNGISGIEYVELKPGKSIEV